MLLLAGLIRYLPLRQNKTGVNLLTTGGNLTTQKVGTAISTCYMDTTGAAASATAAAFAHAQHQRTAATSVCACTAATIVSQQHLCIAAAGSSQRNQLPGRLPSVHNVD
jgi:hypothetical protein